MVGEAGPWPYPQLANQRADVSRQAGVDWRNVLRLVWRRPSIQPSAWGAARLFTNLSHLLTIIVGSPFGKVKRQKRPHAH
ncbi:MAG TPA: hypothetical protein VLA61_13230 [Ideonella sp.]|uniref:hypothetical protein n=1 Tax=Ideonella sp. TaxID=1929293 RepID=UPI002CC23BD6|nr:hypothetical protein [Ideonella sp.]HSI49229.1 hypothetical protein [Ideonella sp.]